MAKISLLPPAAPLTGLENIPVVQDGEARRASLAEHIESITNQAEAARDAAIAAMDVTHYASIAAGEAATVAPAEFIVSPGDGTAIRYRRTGGGSTFLYAIPTAATQAKLTTRAGLSALPIGGTAYASDIEAYFVHDPASVAAANGWGIVAPAVGGGRWVLASDGITLHPRGGGLNDAPNMVAAYNAMAALGRPLKLVAGTYRLSSIFSPGRRGTRLVCPPNTYFDLALVPDGQPNTAGFLYVAGGDAVVGATTLAAPAFPADVSVSMVAAPAVGQYVRLRDLVSGAQIIGGIPVVGFTGATYQVRSVAGAGPYTVGLDRPLLFPLAAGDEAVILSEVSRGHIIEGYPKISGTAVRAIEAVGTFDCDFSVDIDANGMTDVAGSFDLFGFNNHARGTITRTAGVCRDGWLQESQENSSSNFIVRGFTLGKGISLFHALNCEDHSTCTGNLIGGACNGYGAHGCRGSKLLGRYNGNTAQGAAIINGSIKCSVEGQARLNPVNVAVGDNAGGNVSGARIAGDFGSATAQAIIIDATALGTSTGGIDTSDSSTGLLANGNVAVDGTHIHRGSVDIAQGIIVASASVSIALCDYNASNVANVIRTSGDARVSIGGGEIVAAAGSNLANLGGTSHLLLGNVRGVSAGGIGMFFASANAKATLSTGTDLSGVALISSGAGTLDRPPVRIADILGATATTASVAEEVLKSAAIASGAVMPGEVLELTARGNTAANANGKTIRVKFGGEQLISGAGGNDTDWSLRARINVTTLVTQEYEAVLTIGGTIITQTGSLTVDVTALPAIGVTGQNAVASAGDIGATALSVVRNRL